MDQMWAVINPEFCLHNDHLHLSVVRNPIPLTDAKYSVTDEKGHQVFDIKEKLWSIHGRHVVVDNKTNPVATIKKKLFSGGKKWQAAKGSNLVFSTKDSSTVPSEIKMEVHLGGEEKQVSSWDFMVVGTWEERSFVVYNNYCKPIAQIEKKQRGSSILGKDTFRLTVFPRVDYAFIVALLVIICEAKDDTDD